MGKVVFVGKTEWEAFFKILGIKILKTPTEEIKEADLIFSEVSLYEELKRKYPGKLIVSLIDKEGRLLFEEIIKKIIKTTVGEKAYG